MSADIHYIDLAVDKATSLIHDTIANHTGDDYGVLGLYVGDYSITLVYAGGGTLTSHEQSVPLNEETIYEAIAAIDSTENHTATVKSILKPLFDKWFSNGLYGTIVRTGTGCRTVILTHGVYDILFVGKTDTTYLLQNSMPF